MHKVPVEARLVEVGEGELLPRDGHQHVLGPGEVTLGQLFHKLARTDLIW